MHVLIFSLLVLGIFALLVGALRACSLQWKLERGEITKIPGIEQPHDTECCGQHEVCEKDSLLAAVSKDIEYYDDEELDAYIGVAGGSYTEKQTEEFRDVLYTMHSEEVAGWIRSLQLRGIELPEGLKDEVFLLIGERRIKR